MFIAVVIIRIKTYEIRDKQNVQIQLKPVDLDFGLSN